MPETLKISMFKVLMTVFGKFLEKSGIINKISSLESRISSSGLECFDEVSISKF